MAFECAPRRSDARVPFGRASSHACRAGLHCGSNAARGERIELRDYTLEYLRDWLRLLDDADVCRGANREYPIDFAQAATELLEAAKERAAGTARKYAICVDASLVGSCDIRKICRQRSDASIGYWIGRDHWGLGYATQAVRALNAIARDELALRYLYARCLGDNAASQAVLGKCGYVRLGLQSFTHRTTQQRVDTFLYGNEL